MISGFNQTTSSTRIVIPFYIYAAISFLVASSLLVLKANNLFLHHFHPSTLSITHTMALGWGTMIIFGASHQLIPVIIESKIYSEKLGIISFILLAFGIPLLIYGFYVFDMGSIMRWGGRLIILGVMAYVINIAMSIHKSKSDNIHMYFILFSALWLLLTCIFGLALVYNFTSNVLPEDSLKYLPLHAHIGILGWFLLLIIGIGSKLIPMFLISKYKNLPLLKTILILVNSALLILALLYTNYNALSIQMSSIAISIALILFIYFIYQSIKSRIKKRIDKEVRLSIFSIALTILPIFLLSVIINNSNNIPHSIINLYGFFIFFGFITSIILGMSFKTLPFIVWNKVYRIQTSAQKQPKDLYNNFLYDKMYWMYLVSIIAFGIGMIFEKQVIVIPSCIGILLTAVMYVLNIYKIISTKANEN